MWRLVTLRQWRDGPSGKKSPITTSARPCGTLGVPSCCAAPGDSRKSPTSTHATGWVLLKPGPTEADHPGGSVARRKPSETVSAPAAEPAGGPAIDVTASAAPTVRSASVVAVSSRRRRARRLASPISGSNTNRSRRDTANMKLVSLAPLRMSSSPPRDSATRAKRACSLPTLDTSAGGKQVQTPPGFNVRRGAAAEVLSGTDDRRRASAD